MFVEPLFIMGTVLEGWLNYVILIQFYTSIKMITDSQSYSIFQEQILHVLYFFIISKFIP